MMVTSPYQIRWKIFYEAKLPFVSYYILVFITHLIKYICMLFRMNRMYSFGLWRADSMLLQCLRLYCHSYLWWVHLSLSCGLCCHYFETVRLDPLDIFALAVWSHWKSVSCLKWKCIKNLKEAQQDFDIFWNACWAKVPTTLLHCCQVIIRVLLCGLYNVLSGF